MVKRRNPYLGWIAGLMLSNPAASLAQQVAIGSYPVPSAKSLPAGITIGPDGALWFTEGYANTIGRITIAGVITEYQLPANAGAGSITTGPDGALWFTGINSINRMTTAGVVTVYPIPTANSSPNWIVTGPDGALWFTEYYGNQIGRITTTGTINEYPVPTPGSVPYGITAGPDGALWFTEGYANQIGRITTGGTITEYPIAPAATIGLTGITAGPDGALWFTETNSGNIGRITTSGAITAYPVPASYSGPWDITTGPDGALWFTESGTGKLGRITTSGVITEYPTSISYSFSTITTGPDGELWFTEGEANSIGQALFVTATLSVSPSAGFDQSKLTFTGSGFAGVESVQIYTSGVGSAVLANATADTSGSFTATARVPTSPYGHRLFLSLGQSSGLLGAANFSVRAKLLLNPSSGPVGTTVTATGYGFASFQQVKMQWKNPNTSLGTASANVGGIFSGSTAFTFTVPQGALLGPNTVLGGILASATFTVQ